jgi:hypothetical protein
MLGFMVMPAAPDTTPSINEDDNGGDGSADAGAGASEDGRVETGGCVQLAVKPGNFMLQWHPLPSASEEKVVQEPVLPTAAAGAGDVGGGSAGIDQLEDDGLLGGGAETACSGLTACVCARDGATSNTGGAAAGGGSGADGAGAGTPSPGAKGDVDSDTDASVAPTDGVLTADPSTSNNSNSKATAVGIILSICAVFMLLVLVLLVLCGARFFWNLVCFAFDEC